MSFRGAQYPKGINDEESPKPWPKRGLLYQNLGDSSPVQNDMVDSYSKFSLKINESPGSQVILTPALENYLSKLAQPGMNRYLIACANPHLSTG